MLGLGFIGLHPTSLVTHLGCQVVPNPPDTFVDLRRSCHLEKTQGVEGSMGFLWAALETLVELILLTVLISVTGTTAKSLGCKRLERLGTVTAIKFLVAACVVLVCKLMHHSFHHVFTCSICYNG